MFIRQTLLYLPAQILAPALQFATIIVWAHILPVDAVAIATLVVAIQEIGFAAFFMWWSHFVLRHLSKFRVSNEIDKFLGSEPIALIASIVCQVAVITPVTWLYFNKLNLASTAVILAFISTRSVNNYFSERARADAKIRLYTTMQVAVPALGLTLSVLFCSWFGASETSVLGGFAVAQGGSLFLALFDSDFARRPLKVDKSILAGAVTFGIPVMAAQLLSTVALNAPRFIVDQTLGLTAAGAFAVAYGLGLRTSSFAVMLVTAGAYPMVVRKFETEGIEAAYNQLRSNIIMVLLVVVPCALGLLAVNPSVIKILLPSDIQMDAESVLPLAAIGGMLRYMRSHSTDQVFLLKSRPVVSSIISLVDLVLVLIFSTLGAINYGLAGAISGPVIAAAITLIASFSIAHFRFAFAFPFQGLFRILIAGALMAGSVSLLPDTDNIAVLSTTILFGGIVYFVAIWILFPVYANSILYKFRKRIRRGNYNSRD